MTAGCPPVRGGKGVVGLDLNFNPGEASVGCASAEAGGILLLAAAGGVPVAATLGNMPVRESRPVGRAPSAFATGKASVSFPLL